MWRALKTKAMPGSTPHIHVACGCQATRRRICSSSGVTQLHIANANLGKSQTLNNTLGHHFLLLKIYIHMHNMCEHKNDQIRFCLHPEPQLLYFQLICGPLFKCISFRNCVTKTLPFRHRTENVHCFPGLQIFQLFWHYDIQFRKNFGSASETEQSVIPDKENNAFSFFLCHILPLRRTFTLEWNTT